MKYFWMTIVVMVLVAGVAGVAGARTVNYGWEDNAATVLGLYGDGDPAVICSLAEFGVMPVYEGSYSLQLERYSGNTPQAFIACLWGLEDGDEVTASFWRYDMTPGDAPSSRIWAHWNDELPANVAGYSGSAGGSNDYGPGTGWDNPTYTWTVADGHTGLIIEVRIYSNPGDIVWVDSMEVTAPDDVWIQAPDRIYVPDGTVVKVSPATWGEIKALFR